MIIVCKYLFKKNHLRRTKQEKCTKEKTGGDKILTCNKAAKKYIYYY